MTTERLQRCTMKSLREIAEKAGIVLAGKINKDILIDLILEALEEDREERDRTNNPAMRIREKKYDILMEEDPESVESVKFPLPEHYNETKIVLLLRDPYWAFAYWDIKTADIEELKTLYRNPTLCLRVRCISDQGCRSTEGNFFDIPVEFGDRNWYINLPAAGSSYEIDLIGRNRTAQKVLCRSNRIQSPAFDIPETGTEQALKDTGNDLVLLSKLYNFGDEFPLKEIPQRIISLLDTQYLRIKG